MLAATTTAIAETQARRPWVAPALVAAGAIGAGLYVAAVDPAEAGHLPACPLQAATGLACPGCGATRALHALSNLDVGAAVGFNVLAVAAVPVLVVMWALWAVRRNGLGPPPIAAPRAIWAFGAVVMAFTIFRNLPFGAPLAP